MSEWGVVVECELLRPESLSRRQLVERLKQARVPFSEKDASDDDLIELFYQHVTPRPQREPRERRSNSRMETDEDSKSTVSRKRHNLCGEGSVMKRGISDGMTSLRVINVKHGGDNKTRVAGDTAKGESQKIVTLNRKRTASEALSDLTLSPVCRDETASKRAFNAAPIKWP